MRLHYALTGAVMRATVAAVLCTTVATGADYEPDRSVLPIAPPPFTGTMQPTVEQSRVAFPPLVRAPEGAPNVLLIMTDDVGFGAVSTFGGAIPTPNLDTSTRRNSTWRSLLASSFKEK